MSLPWYSPSHFTVQAFPPASHCSPIQVSSVQHIKTVLNLFSLHTYNTSIIIYHLQGSISDTKTHNWPEVWGSFLFRDGSKDSGGCQCCALFLGLFHDNLQKVLPIQGPSACPRTFTLCTAGVAQCLSYTVYTAVNGLYSFWEYYRFG